MKRRLFRICVFLLIMLILDNLFGLGMDKVLNNTEKGDWGRANYLFKELTSDAIILGSSRAIHHYDPRVFSDSLGMSCYNCGEDGMGILLMYARYMAIQKRQIPRLVVYEVLPDYDLLPEKDNLKYLKFLRPYISSSAIDSVVCSISGIEHWKLLSNMYRYNSVFLDIIAQNWSNADGLAKDYTYSPLEKVMDYEPNNGSERKDFSCDSLKLFYLEKLIMNCKANDTKLIFTASPIYKPASDNIFIPLKELCLKYQVPFINHFCDTIFCKTPVYFADAGHLNRKGSELFTSMMVHEIKAILTK